MQCLFHKIELPGNKLPGTDKKRLWLSLALSDGKRPEPPFPL